MGTAGKQGAGKPPHTHEETFHSSVPLRALFLVVLQKQQRNLKQLPRVLLALHVKQPMCALCTVAPNSAKQTRMLWINASDQFVVWVILPAVPLCSK